MSLYFAMRYWNFSWLGFYIAASTFPFSQANGILYGPNFYICIEDNYNRANSKTSRMARFLNMVLFRMKNFCNEIFEIQIFCSLFLYISFNLKFMASTFWSWLIRKLTNWFIAYIYPLFSLFHLLTVNVVILM